MDVSIHLYFLLPGIESAAFVLTLAKGAPKAVNKPIAAQRRTCAFQLSWTASPKQSHGALVHSAADGDRYGDEVGASQPDTEQEA